MPSAPSFTIGIEEEYLLVERQSRELVQTPPQTLMAECQAEVGDLVRPEFMTSQIEIGTPVCRNVGEAGVELRRLRAAVARVADRHGLAPIAASTHPFGQWQDQRHTDKNRYRIIARDMQALGRRLLICGMHVHVGLDDDDLRIELMNQVTFFLPHLLALSTSSPFWAGEDTGLQSFRLSIYNELPRTGLPAPFASFREYRRHVEVLIRAGLFADATMLWWDIRPSDRYPTLEMRITDVCTRVEDAVCIAALYICLLRMLHRLRGAGRCWPTYPAMLLDENRWRAQRYGLDEGLVDFAKGCMVSGTDLVEEILALIGEDAEALGCTAEIGHARTIAGRGTSAHRQRRVFAEALAAGADRHQALTAVVDMLIAETVDDL